MNHLLRDFLAEGGPFQGYTYAYPHKTAYRRLADSRHLSDAWANQDKSALFLYVHVPFCEMRCGFCNLFTTTNPDNGLVSTYLDALARQSDAVAAALGASARFSRLSIGGGTPTFLSTSELERVFALLNRNFPGSGTTIPRVIEASPATVDHEKIAFLKSEKVTRVSLGVQSFIETEVRALRRAQKTDEVRQALGMLTSAKLDCVNVDLIYGTEGQTARSWKYSLDQALEFAPEEIYLYPLYIRPLTQLDRLTDRPADIRLELYRAGRDFLLSHGYRQISMRLFRKASYAPPEGPVYCCQEDGMIGLGSGARSYTSGLHYSTEYAVGRQGVMEVITDYNHRASEEFSFVDYGFELDLEEQKRRYVLKSLLRIDGLNLADYHAFFSTDVFDDFPQLNEIIEEKLGSVAAEALQLTPAGMELSDVIGPWLWSPAVRDKMNEFVLR